MIYPIDAQKGFSPQYSEPKHDLKRFMLMKPTPTVETLQVGVSHPWVTNPARVEEQDFLHLTPTCLPSRTTGPYVFLVA
jgi:hypothetical protein